MKSDLQLSLFYDMLRVRRIEETIGLRYKEQKMRCPIHLSIGQEAIAVGVCAHLEKKDGLFSNHRCHAHYLAKGGNFHKMMAELYGKKNGCTKGRGGSMHLIDLDVGFQGSSPIAAGSIPIATGWAFASQMKQEDKVCATFFGEAATEEGVFAESLNFAALKKLPLLFICENNRYAIHSPTDERQSVNRSRVKIAKAHGIYAAAGNGNKIEEVYEITKEALSYVKEGNGPAFIEFETYRLCEHVGSRKPEIGYRNPDEITTWKDLCPIKQYQEKLIAENTLTSDTLDDMEAKISAEIDYSFSFAEESPFPQFDLDDENAYAK